jgi:TonB family protein
MSRILAWFRDVFRNDDIVSALSGEPLEAPFTDPKRKRNARIFTVFGYVALVASVLFISTVLPEPPKLSRNPDLPNLIFVMQPGPGGGGGGSEASEEPPSIQKIEGEDQAKVAINVEAPKEDLVYDDPEKPNVPEEEKVAEDEDVTTVEAPVVAQAPDDETQKGILEGPESLIESPGGNGQGTGIGEGRGSGLGEGYGGGFGGGAYRMGSGITSPIVLKEVRPQFTSDALARKIQGEVLVEVVILKDGTVRPMRILKGLTADLNEKALDAASRWKFIPGKFQGKPVDVIAEIVVNFNIL